MVFDEPEVMTEAKQEEQRRRDASRALPVFCSSDLAGNEPNDDSYTTQYIQQTSDVHRLIDNRATRGRFFDEVMRLVLVNLNAQIQRWVKSGFLGGHVLCDGVDPRGADRPTGEERRPGVLSSHPDLWTPLLTREEPMGEGDLKLTDVCSRVFKQRADAPGSPLANVLLNLVWTIDTDSFLIELMQQARREERPRAEDRNDLTLLCLREPARKRKDELPTQAYFTCIDMSIFYDEVINYIFARNVAPPDFARRKRQACALFAAGVALCGCDYVKVDGTRCDLMLPCIRDVARNRPDLLQLMEGCFTGKADLVRDSGAAIQAVVENYLEAVGAMGGRLTKSVHKASTYSDLQVLRTSWIVAYWLGTNRSLKPATSRHATHTAPHVSSQATSSKTAISGALRTRRAIRPRRRRQRRPACRSGAPRAARGSWQRCCKTARWGVQTRAAWPGRRWLG